MINNLPNLVKKIRQNKNSLVKTRNSLCQYINYQKIFLVGNNKTGTTSLETWFSNLGFLTAPQRQIENIYFSSPADINAVFNLLSPYLNAFEVFQDLPFSRPDYLQSLLKYFPNQAFIYTSRDSCDWYNSLLNHHSQAAGFSINKSSPIYTIADKKIAIDRLSQWKYRDQSMLAHVMSRYSCKSEDDIYDFNLFTGYHNYHEANARKLLKSYNSIFIDLTKDDSVHLKLAKFLDFSPKFFLPSLPHENRRR